MAIQLFTPAFRTEECLAEIRECLEKGWTGLGYKTVAIEDQWKEFTGLPHAHFLASNTVGLHLAVEMLKRKHGWADADEIISTPLTFVSTNHAIKYSNLTPVFADVDEFLCLDPASVLERITPRTRAVVFVGMGGNTGRYCQIVDLCRKRGLKLILDAAHMAGTRSEGAHVGREADVVVFSFQAVKNLPTADSGMICFAHMEDDQLVRKLSWLGINKDTYSRTTAHGAYKWMYEVEELGYKYHGNSIMAAIALVQLKYLDADNAFRRQLAEWYRQGLRNGKARVVPTVDDCESAQHLFQVRIKNRNELIMALNEHDVFPGVHYRDNTDYAIYNQLSGTCPQAALASQQVMSLPLHLRLTKRDVDAVCELVNRYAE
jgi:dTDP-4-amino-4,6-dideoxygalactose transaminase